MKKSFLSLNRNIYLLFLAAAFILYGNTLKNNYAIDDNLVLQNNPVIDQGLSGIPLVFSSKYVTNDKRSFDYRPVVKLLAGIEVLIWGYRPALSHLINILLYALALIVLFRLLKKILPDYEQTLVMLIVLLFAAHPVHTEVVASIKNRDELLSFLFALLSADRFFLWVDSGRLKHFIFASGLFFIAMLSKSSAFVFIALIPLVIWFSGKLTLKEGTLIAVSTFILGAAFFIIPRFIIGGEGRNPDFFENPLFFDRSFDMKLGTAGFTLLHYSKLLLFPFRLLYYYGYDMIPVVSVTDPVAIISLLAHAALFVWGIILLRRNHPVGLGIVYYFIAVSMFSNILIPAVGIVADRFVFNASLGLCIILGYLFFKGQQERKHKKGNEFLKLFGYLLIPLLIFYSVKTISRNTAWKDSLTLYENDMPHLDRSFKAHLLYSNAMFKEIVRTSSDQRYASRNMQWTHLSVGLLNEALTIWDQYPNAWNTLGAFHFMILKDYQTAGNCFSKALNLNPDYTEALFNMGFCYENLGKPDSAMVFYSRCIRSDSLYANAYNRTLLLQLQAGDTTAALNTNSLILSQFPESDAPHINLGNYYLMTGDTIAAFLEWEKAIEKMPENPPLLDALVQYYRMTGNNQKEEKYLQLQRSLLKNNKHQKAPPFFL
jgi:protein O-mannosyl-transferase